MSESSAVEALPDRRTSLGVFGVMQALVGLACWGMAALVSVVPQPEGAPQAGRGTGLAAFALIGAAFLAAGIGSVLRKQWARLLSLVLNGLWLFSGVCGAATILLVVPRTNPSAASPAMLAGIATVFAFTMVLPPLVLLFFYSRKSVRASCTGGVPGQPTAVLILAGWFLLGACGSVPGLFGPPVVVLFGWFLRGVPALLFGGGMACLMIFTGWSIYRRRRIGWTIGIGLVCFWLAGGAVTFARTNLSQMFREMGIAAQPAFESYGGVFLAFGLAIAAAQLGLLLYTRRYIAAA
jgi:hypothetical protein